MARLKNLAARWCWPCLFLGVVLLFGVAGAATASPGGPLEGFTARDLVLGLLSLVIALGGAFFAGMRSRMTKIEEGLEGFQRALLAAERHNTQEIAKLERMLLRDYHSKDEVASDLGKLERMLEALHRRLDRMNVPAAPPNHTD